jgi:hypothetical protein
MVSAPPELRQRIIAALDSERTLLPVERARLTCPPLWLGSVAAAAAVLLLAVLIRGPSGPSPNSGLDDAVKVYLSSQRGFASAAGLDTLSVLAVALANEFGYPLGIGFLLVGN